MNNKLCECNGNSLAELTKSDQHEQSYI